MKLLKWHKIEEKGNLLMKCINIAEKALLPKEKILEIIECLQRIETDENYKKSRDDYYYIGR